MPGEYNGDAISEAEWNAAEEESINRPKERWGECFWCSEDSETCGCNHIIFGDD